MFRENTAYFILALVAIVLIGITIGLQIVLLSEPQTTAGTLANVAEGQPNLASNVQGDAQTNSGQATGLQAASGQSGQNGGTQDDAVVLALPTPTSTPSVIVLEPAAEQPANQAAESVPPTPTTALPTTALPNAASVNSDASPLIAGDAAADGQQPAQEAEPASPASQAPNPKETVLSATNVTASDDNSVLAAIVQSNAFAVSFVPYAFYAGASETLRAIGLRSNNGVVVEPNVDTLSNGQYPLARPLFIYSTAAAIQSKAEVQTFISCYLNWVPQEISTAGYFRLSESRFEQALSNFAIATNSPRNALPPCTPNLNPAPNIDVVGSSTVAPLTEHIAQLFNDRGYQGSIQVFETGTGGGFERFCRGEAMDIVNASRPIKESELAACRSNGIEPLVFPVGADAVAIVVNPANTFVDSLSYPQLWNTFSNAKLWSDVNPAWPSEQITRAVRRRTSGTLDFFIAEVFDSDFEADPILVQSQPAAPTPAPQPAPEAPPTPAQPQAEQADTTSNQAQAPASVPASTNPGAADIVFGVIERDHSCPLMTEVVSTVIADELQLATDSVELSTADELYAALGEGDVDVTLCYIDPDDRSFMADRLGLIRQIGTSHWAEGNYKMLTWANSTSKSNMRSENRCLLDLLEKVVFASSELDVADASAWISENSAIIETWLSCPYTE